MRKKIAGKCLFIALAAAMVFGTPGLVRAEGAGGEAETATLSQTTNEPTIKDAEFKTYSYGGIYIHANGSGGDATLYINGIEASSYSPGYYYWWVSRSFTGRAGATYTAKVKVTDSEGKSVEKVIGSETMSGISIDSSRTEAKVSGTTTTDKGYNKAYSVRVYTQFTENNYNYFRYEVQRAESKKGTYTTIYSGEKDNSDFVSYYDYDIEAGKTYYYRVKIYSGTDSYVTTDKLLATTKTMEVNTSKPSAKSVYLSAYAYSMDDVTGKVTKTKAGVYVSMSSDFANQYDIYRSTNEKKGYKKIKTVYTGYYFDTSIKQGTTYYYYVIPKYYDSKTKKLTSGKKSDVVAAKYVMDNAWSPELTQISKNSLKITWGGGKQPQISGVTYEIWYRRTDITGDAYKKAGNATGKRFVLKKLAADGEYAVRLKAVKKSGSKVLYERTINTFYKQMGYTDSVTNLSVEAKSSSLSKDQKTLTLKYKITWDRDWGASGYIVSAYNNYTGKTDTFKVKSGKKTSYTLKNISTTYKGIKYTSIYVTPYKGKTSGDASSTVSVDDMPATTNVKAAKSGTSVKVKWTAVKGASSYSVYRSTGLDSSSWKLLDTVTTNSYVDKNADVGMEYSYKINVNTTFSGVYSQSTSSELYLCKLAKVKNVKAVNSSKKKAKLTWKKVAGAKYYVVYRSTSKNGTYKKVGKTTKTAFVNTKLKKGKTYYYKVTAVAKNEGGQTVQSAYSKVKAVKVKK